MVKISTISNSAYLGIGIFMILLTAMFIGMRFAISARQYKKIQLDDWLSVIGLVLVVALYAFNEFQYKQLFKPVDLDYMTNTGIAVPIMAAFSTWASKVPVLLLYLRLFGVHTWVRYACRFTLIISALGFLASCLPPLINCHPNDEPHTPLKWKKCGRANINAGVIAGTVSVAADLAIMIIPLRPITTLNLSTRRRVGLVIVFCSGIFGLVASVVSLVYKIHLYTGAQGNKPSLLTTMLLQFVESAIALMVGCVPAIRGYWKGFIEPSKLYSAVGSLRTKLISSRASRSSKNSKGSDSPYQKQDYDLDKFGVMGSINRPGADDAYILMESAHASKNDVHKN